MSTSVFPSLVVLCRGMAWAVCTAWKILSLKKSRYNFCAYFLFFLSWQVRLRHYGVDRTPHKVARRGGDCVFPVRLPGNPRGESGHPRRLLRDWRHDWRGDRTEGEASIHTSDR